MNEKDGDNLWCIGRFRFILPKTLVLLGRSQSIYLVSVRTVPISSTQEVQSVWADQLTRIQALVPPPGFSSVVVRSFELQLDISAIWYMNNQQYDGLRKLEAMKPQVNYMFLLTFQSEAGKEVFAETLLKNVANAYAPGFSRGFCVEHGSITSELGENEQTQAYFAHRTLPNFEIRFSTYTVCEPSKMIPLSEIDNFRAVYGSQGVQLKVLKDEARTVAGLSGKENITSLAEPGKETSVNYIWHFPGASLRSDQPEILLDAHARLADQKELQAVWDLLLQSMQRIPMQ